ncbi:MAG: metallophosphoesterase, partial [Ectothiorhodospiraceae bacterium]|nr:metallophosphoesterase [Ectothiorhodospiraceae bacterium]
MTTEILRLHRNEKGRDFVVGDIHGCFGQLDVELQRVGFDPARDRCLSVGDLVDRGPDSFAALEWIGRPWFHACLGNHDDMVLNASADPADLAWWVMRNEGGWWLDLDQATQDRFIEGFGRLPLAIEVETAHGRVGIVHADVPAGMGWDAFVAALAAGDARVRETALWGRSRATGAVRTP